MTSHRQHGRALLAALKHTTTTAGPALTLGSGQGLTLRPVATSSPRDEDVGRLTEWRNRHVTAFLTEFDATRERTARWLREIVGPDDGRLVFMVDDADGRTFGYLGLAYIDWSTGSFEVDGVVRGLAGPKGGMSDGLATLVSWATAQLGLAEPRVRVRSDNPRAVAFYQRLGFVPIARRPLRPVVEPGMLRWVEGETASADGPTLVHMTWPLAGSAPALTSLSA